MSELIRRAQPGDEIAIVEMIRELAEFEEAADECTVTETQMHAALFGPNPTAYAHMVEVDGERYDTQAGCSGPSYADVRMVDTATLDGLLKQAIIDKTAEAHACGSSNSPRRTV